MLPGAADASDLHAFEREREAAGGASHGQQQALGEGLPDEASVAGAERPPDRHLADAPFSASQQEARHVGARDEQKESHRHRQQHQPRANGAEDLVVERNRKRLETHRLRVRAFPRAGTRDRAQLLVCLRERRARGEPRHGVEAMVAALRAGRIDRERRPQLGRLGEVFSVIGRQLKAFRHDADDGELAPVDTNTPVQDGGVAAEPPLPERMAQHDDGIASLDFLVGRERAAEQQSRAERGEHSRRDLRRADALGLEVGAGQVGLRRPPGAHVAKRFRAAVVEQLGFRHPRLVPSSPT